MTTPAKPRLYLFGVPGTMGGAATKIAHLLRLLHRDFQITVVPPAPQLCRDRKFRAQLEPYQVTGAAWKDLPRQLEGVGLAICERNFFNGGLAREVKARGLRLVWSNEMMFPFPGEAEAAREGVIDRVLFVSEFQARAFADIHRDVPSCLTGNYVDPEEFPWRERRNPLFTLGRLSRPDPEKYPLDFPVFYEEFGLREARYRVMAWNPEVARQYRWHRFGPEWDLLTEGRESARAFLHSLDAFVYPLGHRVKESWGRAVVEAMLTGCVPVVPAGHQFHELLVHGEGGFICGEFREWRDCVRALDEDHPLRLKLSRQAAAHAREHLCNPEQHRQRWLGALTF